MSETTTEPEGLARARAKMTDAGVYPAAIEAFASYYRQLEQGATGQVAESDIEPLTDPPRLTDVELGPEQAADALARVAVIKLNGGLGTSMGMTGPKSLLPVRGEQTFLDLIIEQVRHARASHGVPLPLILMDSFRTREPTLARVAAHDDVIVADLPVDFLQSQEPKLRADDLAPVDWPDDRELEWTPPGHGDLYPSLRDSGVLQALLDAGYAYACVSNVDNLGATPSPELAAWFADSGAPFALEVCRRTRADRKGGHLAIRRADGRLILRESAQVRDDDADAFSDTDRHGYFNTNNLWLDLRALADVLAERDGVLGLPMIVNRKTVDPADPESPKVIQIETAMGAAIEAFEGAQVIEVPRSRFQPVKTTNDLLVVRSDAYSLADDGHLEAVADPAPVVDLDPRHYKLVGDFDARFPDGPPSLRDAASLTVRGDWTFGADVRVVGDAELADPGTPSRVEPGTELS